MRIPMLSSLALSAFLTTTATAEPMTPATTGPVALSDAQMDKVTAGLSPGFGNFSAFTAQDEHRPGGCQICGPNGANPPGLENRDRDPGLGLNTAKGIDLPL